MNTRPLLIGAGEDFQDFYRRFPFGEEAVVVIGPDLLLDHLRREQWDLVLLDCGEEISLGLGLLREIKPAFPAIPVLVVVDGGNEETAIAAFRLGARDYVRRPFDLIDLKSRIETLLRLKRGSGGHHRFFAPSEVHLAAIGKAQAGDFIPGDFIPPTILRSIKYMEDNLAKSVHLNDLAREAGISRHHFCRTFGEVMKMPPMKFLSYLRVQKAKKLLGRKGVNLSAVVMKVGFGNVANMNKWFKVFEGISPTRYRSGNQGS